MKKILLVLPIILLMVGCNWSKNSKNKQTENVNIENIHWVLSEYKGEPISPFIEGKVHIFMNKDNGRLSGYAGCNNMMGTYEIKDDIINFKDVATTKMACPETDWNEAEFIASLNNIKSFSATEDKLILKCENGTDVIVFIRLDESSIQNKYWRLNMLDGDTVKMAENQEREQFMILRTDSTMIGFAGCNTVSGNYKLADDNAIEFRNTLTTMKACPDVDVDESAFLKVFEYAKKYDCKDDQLILYTEQDSTLATFEAIYF